MREFTFGNGKIDVLLSLVGDDNIVSLYLGENRNSDGEVEKDLFFGYGEKNIYRSRSGASGKGLLNSFWVRKISGYRTDTFCKEVSSPCEGEETVGGWEIHVPYSYKEQKLSVREGWPIVLRKMGYEDVFLSSPEEILLFLKGQVTLEERVFKTEYVRYVYSEKETFERKVLVSSGFGGSFMKGCFALFHEDLKFDANIPVGTQLHEKPDFRFWRRLGVFLHEGFLFYVRGGICVEKQEVEKGKEAESVFYPNSLIRTWLDESNIFLAREGNLFVLFGRVLNKDNVWSYAETSVSAKDALTIAHEITLSESISDEEKERFMDMLRSKC